MAAETKRRQRTRGSETLEFGFVMVPMLGFVFLIIDLSWAVFARGTLQFAVREGCRYAITGQSDAAHQADAIKKRVQDNAMGLLAGSNGLSKIQITLRDQAGNDVTAMPGANSFPNTVEVSAQGLTVTPLFPLFKSTPLVMSATSSDVINVPSSSAPPM